MESRNGGGGLHRHYTPRPCLYQPKPDSPRNDQLYGSVNICGPANPPGGDCKDAGQRQPGRRDAAPGLEEGAQRLGIGIERPEQAEDGGGLAFRAAHTRWILRATPANEGPRIDRFGVYAARFDGRQISDWATGSRTWSLGASSVFATCLRSVTNAAIAWPFTA